MADVAELGVKVTLSGAQAAAAGLDKVAQSGANAEQATRRTIGATDGLTASQRFLMQQNIALTDVLARVNGETASLSASQAEVARSITQTAAATESATATFNVAGAGLGRLRMGFTSLVASMTGVSPLLARIIATVGVMEAGLAPVLAVLAAIAVIAVSYKAWHEEAAKANEEQKKLTESLMKWYEVQKQGVAGEFPKQIEAMTAKIKDLRKELDGLANNKLLAGAEAVGQGGSKWMAWLRIFTAGDISAVAKQFAAEVAKGTGVAAKAVTDGGKAIDAAKAEVLKRQQDEFLTNAQSSVDLDRDEMNALDAKSAAMLKQLDVMRSVNEENNLALTQAQFRLDAIGKEGLDLDLLHSTQTAQLETMRALHDLSGIALTDRLAAIQAEKDLNDATAKATAVIQARNEMMKQASAIGKANEATAKAQINETANEIKKAAAEAQKPIDTMLKDIQRSFAGFFDQIFTNGVTSFSSLFDDIKKLFFKMIAEMLAADVMKKISGGLAGIIGGMMGIPSTASAQGGGVSGAMPSGGWTTAQTAGAGLGIAGAGFGVGSLIGSQTSNRALGALGGAAGGAATGAAIGAMGGPIGVAAGAIIGGAAGLVGGFLGAKHSAEALAEAQRKLQLAEAQVGATLADWRAQITGTAADQRAAARADLYYKYLSIVQTIEQVEAGKKMEEQRNKDLAEAAALYQKASAALGKFTDSLLNAVQGYKYQATIFGAAPFGGAPSPIPAPSSGGSQPGSSTGGGTSPSDGGGGALTVKLVMPDGTALGSAVIADWQKRKRTGDHNLQVLLS